MLIAIMLGLPKKGYYKKIDEPPCPCLGTTKNVQDNALVDVEDI